MALFFFDTSALVKYYVSEPGSHWVRRIVTDVEQTKVVCEICLPEVAAAMARLQRAGVFGQRFVRNTYTRLRTDLHLGVLLSHPADLLTLELAAKLAMQYPLKGYDAVQVASGLLTQRRLRSIAIFVSSDHQALHAAAAEGMTCEDPLAHTHEDLQA